MSESPPPVVPPKRINNHFVHIEHTTYNALPSTATSSASPVACKLEPCYRAVLGSGSQSAKSSPLPHRRLDKLEGIIRDNPATSSTRTILDSDEINNRSHEASPLPLRKYSNRFISNHQESPMPYRKEFLNLHLTNESRNRNNGSYFGSIIRKRFYSDSTNNETKRVAATRHDSINCGCIQNSRPMPFITDNGSDIYEISAANANSLEINRRYTIASPANDVLGEPGCFSSPIHQPLVSNNKTNNGPNRSVTKNESNGCTSPARSIYGLVKSKIIDGNNEVTLHHQSNQTVISGWLKFRDNKRVSTNLLKFMHKRKVNSNESLHCEPQFFFVLKYGTIFSHRINHLPILFYFQWKIRWGVVTKLSPAAGELSLFLIGLLKRNQ